MRRSIPSPPASNLAGAPATGLPRVNYRTPLVVTLVAALFLLLVAALLGLLGVINTFTEWGRASNNQVGSSFLGAGLCGLLSLAALAGVVYFVFVVGMGVRDLGEKPFYTRGQVVPQRTFGGRRGKDWLLVKPEYAGTDLDTASRIDDEHRAASVDRSQIFQPRFASDSARKQDREDAGTTPGPPGQTPGGYLSPDRISVGRQAEPFKPEPEADEEPGVPHVIFRIDFASNAKLTPGEEVLVAHSRHLQHIYYVARLRDGEWEAYRNRRLI